MKKIKTILDLIKAVSSGDATHYFLNYAYLTEDEIRTLSKKTGIEIHATTRVIASDEIKHAYKRHCNDECPLQWEDFTLIMLITTYYDSVKRGSLCNGLQTIVYEKLIGDKYFVVEELRTGRRKLAFKTMYKHMAQKKRNV